MRPDSSVEPRREINCVVDKLSRFVECIEREYFVRDIFPRERKLCRLRFIVKWLVLLVFKEIGQLVSVNRMSKDCIFNFLTIAASLQQDHSK